MTFDESMQEIYLLPTRVVSTWQTEFGYTQHTTADILAERGPRFVRELNNHAKRLAERAQMSSAPVGRASVIR